MKNVSKSKILILVILDVLLVVSVLLISFFQSERQKRMYSQQAGARWGTEDVECAEVSAFFSEKKNETVEDISGIRNKIMKTLYDDAYIDENEGKTHRSWIDAYSTKGQFEISRNDRSLTANVYGVSDDFFLVHPIPLKSGGYLNPVKTMVEESDGEDPFQIVIDENVAWNIFGGNDVAGMKVWMGGRIFTVMGVVAAAENKTEEMAYGNFDGVYVPYAAFAKMGIENAPITCYEAVMPNPIPNYAYNALAEACDVTEMTDSEKEQLRSTLFFGDTEVLENTNRFSIPSLYKYVKSKKYMTMRTDSISYPYWENIARFEVERASRLFIFCCILLLLPAATVIGTIIWLYTKRGVVFNSRNKEKVMDFLGEFAEGVKNRLKHPEKENYDEIDTIEVTKYYYNIGNQSYDINLRTNELDSYSGAIEDQKNVDYVAADIVSITLGETLTLKDGNYVLDVTATNNGKEPLKSLSIYIEFYDEDGNSLDRESVGGLDMTLEPGKTVKTLGYCWSDYADQAKTFAIVDYEYDLNKKDQNGYNHYTINKNVDCAYGMEW